MYSATAILFIAVFLNCGINNADFTICSIVKPCEEDGTTCCYSFLLIGSCKCRTDCPGLNLCCTGYICNLLDECVCDNPCDNGQVCGEGKYCYDNKCCRPCEDDEDDYGKDCVNDNDCCTGACSANKCIAAPTPTPP